MTTKDDLLSSWEKTNNALGIIQEQIGFMKKQLEVFSDFDFKNVENIISESGYVRYNLAECLNELKDYIDGFEE